ncbi:MAG: aminotransferase class I/II-fold pyridoxal phosphate-dependent enzyme [Oscillospiraceae bacterium]|jgi:aminotransferase|nr:aminotransferase class I/II-fold pyridoxal phosphate-dependent enzyme [Oscillospiraceae bacterium]
MDYSKILSGKVQDLKPSGIRKFFDIMEEMPDAIKLSVGEPDFQTPWHIRDAGIYSLEKGWTKYSPNTGFMNLRRELSRYLLRRFDLRYDPTSEVLVTVGGSEAIDLGIRAIVNPGDEVIIPSPSFVCYEPLTLMANGVPVIVNTKAENEFRLTAEQLSAAISPKTKLLILPYPCNPTGAIMRRQDLEAIAEVLRGTDIMVLSDEIYAELTYGQTHISTANIEGMRERTIVVNGFSKSYSMTGWRLGYACAPAPVMAQLTKLHQFALMCAPATSQYAAIEALKEGDKDIEHMRAEYDRHRLLLLTGLRELGLDCFEAKGAFYLFPNISGFGLSSDAFSEEFLKKEQVAVISGSAFGAAGEGFVRMCYAASERDIKEALVRLKRFIGSI